VSQMRAKAAFIAPCAENFFSARRTDTILYLFPAYWSVL
jgi:hypothetical protein